MGEVLQAKRTRKPKTNYKQQHDQLVMYLRLSIRILNGLRENTPEGDNENVDGQIAALKAVQQQIGEGGQ